MSGDTDQQPKAPAEQVFLTKHRQHFLIALAILCILMTVPVWLLVDNYRDSGGVEALAYGASLSAPRDDYFGTAVVVYSPTGTAEPNFCVTFEFLSLDEDTSQAIFGILIDATSSGWQLLNQLTSSRYPPATLALLMTSTSGLNSTPVSFPLPSRRSLPNFLAGKHPVSCNSGGADIRSLDRFALWRTTESIFTLGTPRSFPDDWYELDDTATVSIPGWPVSSSLIMTSRDEDYTLAASVYRPDEHSKNAGPNALEFTIRRPWLFVVYTYLVAAMPFFLLITIFSMKYRRKHMIEEMPKHTEVAFGVTATLVAILPLRSVLVPSSLPSPTRLDLYFGLGAVFLVALSIIWVVRTSPPKAHRVRQGGATADPSRQASGKGATEGTDALSAGQVNPNGEGTPGIAPQPTSS